MRFVTVTAAVLLVGTAAPLWADDSSDSQGQAVSQTGAGGANGPNQGGNGFSAPIKSQFNTSPNNSPNPANPNGDTGSAVPSGQINTSHELLQSQIQAANGSGAVNPGIVNPGVKVGVNPGPPYKGIANPENKVGVNPGPTQKGSAHPGPIQKAGSIGLSGKGSKLKSGKASLSNGKGFQKAMGLNKTNGLSKNVIGGAGGTNTLPAVQK